MAKIEDKQDCMVSFRCHQKTRKLLKKLSEKLSDDHGIKITYSDVIKKAVNELAEKEQLTAAR